MTEQMSKVAMEKIFEGEHPHILGGAKLSALMEMLPSVSKGEIKNIGLRKLQMKDQKLVLSVILLSFVMVGCVTPPATPYEYTAEKEDATSISDPFVKTEDVTRLKVSVRPKKAVASDEKDVSADVCGKLKGRIAESDFFEVASRDDLVNIKVEGELSGKKWSDDVPPSELLLLVEAKVVNYLGGVTQAERERLKTYYDACMARKMFKEAIKTQQQLRAANQKSVDDPSQAFGVEIEVTCSAYDVETMQQYVAIASTVSEISDTKGRIDAAIDQAAQKVAADVIEKFTQKVAPAMKTDCVIAETRGNGKVAKVDVSALRRTFVKDERAVVYTHVKSGKKSRRREIAKGRVWEIEDGCVWIEVTQEKGYGKVHVGHCVDFPEVHVK